MSSEIVYSEVERAEFVPDVSGPKDPTALAAAPHSEERGALFPSDEIERLRARWREIQGNFVDEPRNAVQHADELVEQVVRRLTEVFAGERANLENEWSQGKDVSTEDLRRALRRYRSFFDRLLSV
jgi:hypothetical protein